MNWYINRKTNELVQAEKGVRLWTIITTSGYQMYLSNFDFQSQYGDAMVNNPMIPADDKPHIKDKFCDNLGCIPYIPEQKQADDEPVFPICGTCNAQKEQELSDNELQEPKAGAMEMLLEATKPKPSLLLSDEEIKAFVKEMGWRDNPAHLADIISQFKAFQERLLDHLAKLGIVYVKNTVCDKKGHIRYKEYIPLSDYMKEKENESNPCKKL